MLLILFFIKINSKGFGVKPLITPGWVRKYNYNWILSSDKARKNIGYKITPLRTGIARTVDFIKTENH